VRLREDNGLFWNSGLDWLVIDTVGFIEHSLSFVDNFNTPHTKDLHVVERWKLNDGPSPF
jgi:hypothetical protein